MSSYTLDSLQVGTSYDEMGVSMGLPRLPAETMPEYRARLLSHLIDPPDASEKTFARTVGRMVGLEDVEMFRLSLTGDSLPVDDPAIEITPSHFRVYSDYSSSELELELNILPNVGSHRFIGEVRSALTAVAWLDIEDIGYDSSWEYKESSFRLDFSERMRRDVPLRRSTLNDFEQMYVKSVGFNASAVFKTKVASVDDIAKSGDYFLDEYEGLVWTYDEARNFCHVIYRDFPFRVWYQHVRTWPLSHPDSEQVLFDQDRTLPIGYDQNYYGTPLLTPMGASVVNELLSVNPLQWGE